MTSAPTIGFDRKVRLEWLDATAALVSRGLQGKGLYLEVRKAIGDLDPESGPHGAFGKTATVLLKIWANPPRTAVPLRDRALELLPKVAPEERVAVHWGLTLAVYPFVFEIASTLGRLMALHEKVSFREIRQRLVEKFGDRSTLAPATQRILRGFIEWGVLCESSERGTYARAGLPRVTSPSVGLLLVEAVLTASSGGALPLTRAVSHPALFPFATVPLDIIRKAIDFQVQRQGLDSELVSLRQ